jgi:hypothetical protein
MQIADVVKAQEVIAGKKKKDKKSKTANKAEKQELQIVKIPARKTA